MKTWQTLGCALIVATGACGEDNSDTVGAGGRDGADAATGGASGEAAGPDGGAPDVDSGDAAGGVPGCEGATFREPLGSPADRGPYVVGARTVQLDGLSVEVLYPAAPGSEAGKAPRRYDIRQHLPEGEQAKVPDEDNPWQQCDCYGDLAIDDSSGPYPVVVFAHGTAGFRTQSLELQTHWASYGFVVISADHPGLQMADLLGQVCGGSAVPQHLAADIEKLLAALDAPSGDLAFLAEHVDPTRIGMVGHSAGGGAISGFGDVAQVLVPMAARGVSAGSTLRATLVLGAMSDTVSSYAQQVSGYESSPAPKSLVGLENAGHLAFTSLCEIRNAAGEDFVAIANEHGICGIQLAGFLFDCDPDYVPARTGWDLANHATTSVFRESLQCQTVGAGLDAIEAAFPGFGEFRSE